MLDKVVLIGLRSPEKKSRYLHARTTLSQQRGGSGRGSRLAGALPARPARRAAESQASGEGGCAAGSGKAEWVEARVSGHAPEPAGVQLPPPRPVTPPGTEDPEGQLWPPSQRRVTRDPSGAAGLGARVHPGSEGLLPRSPRFPARASPTLRPRFPHTNFPPTCPLGSEARLLRAPASGGLAGQPPRPERCPEEGWGSVPRGKHTPKPASEGSRVQALGEARWDKLGKPDRATFPGPYASLQSDPQHSPAATPGRRSSDPVPASPSRGPPKAS